VEHIVIRPGRAEDEHDIQEFTRHTFDWGDYVADAYGSWVKDAAVGKGDVFVAVDMPSGKVVGVTHTRYLSPEEAWFEGIRVHPDHRREGIGRLLTTAAIEGARRRGINICRAAIDGDNLKSQGLSRGFGFEPVVPIIQFIADIAKFTPTHSSDLSLRDAEDADAEAVYQIVSREMSYIGSDYTWWRVTPENVERVIGERNVRLAIDSSGQVVAGATISDTFVDEHSDEPVLYAEISSVFGSIDGVHAIAAEYCSSAAAIAAEKGLPCMLSVICEARSSVASVLPKHGFTERFLEGRRDEVWLWELLLD
jgi:ribosomal protein S18 acetylase RimI-like enzyme